MRCRCPRGADCDCILAGEDSSCIPRAGIVSRVANAEWELNADGKYLLKSCPAGHQKITNDADNQFSFAAQECQECPVSIGLQTPGSGRLSLRLIMCAWQEGFSCTDEVCNEECSECPVGTYKQVKGAGACIECPRNTYNPNSGSKTVAECRDCPPNSQTEGKGASDYTACTCSSGYYPAVAAENNNTDSQVYLVCEVCPLGGDCTTNRGQFTPAVAGSIFQADEKGYMRVISCPRGARTLSPQPHPRIPTRSPYDRHLYVPTRALHLASYCLRNCWGAPD